MTYDEIVKAGREATQHHTLNAKIATGLSEIFRPNYRFNLEITLIETRMELEGEIMSDRAMAKTLWEWMKLDEVDGAMLDFSDLLKNKLQGDDLEGFINNWEMTLYGMKEIPLGEYMESLLRYQLASVKIGRASL